MINFEKIDWEKQQKGVDEVKQGIGKWNTSNITFIGSMFENATTLNEEDCKPAFKNNTKYNFKKNK